MCSAQTAANPGTAHLPMPIRNRRRLIVAAFTFLVTFATGVAFAFGGDGADRQDEVAQKNTPKWKLNRDVNGGTEKDGKIKISLEKKYSSTPTEKFSPEYIAKVWFYGNDGKNVPYSICRRYKAEPVRKDLYSPALNADLCSPASSLAFGVRLYSETGKYRWLPTYGPFEAEADKAAGSGGDSRNAAVSVANISISLPVGRVDVRGEGVFGGDEAARRWENIPGGIATHRLTLCDAPCPVSFEEEGAGPAAATEKKGPATDNSSPTSSVAPIKPEHPSQATYSVKLITNEADAKPVVDGVEDKPFTIIVGDNIAIGVVGDDGQTVTFKPDVGGAASVAKCTIALKNYAVQSCELAPGEQKTLTLAPDSASLSLMLPPSVDVNKIENSLHSGEYRVEVTKSGKSQVFGKITWSKNNLSTPIIKFYHSKDDFSGNSLPCRVQISGFIQKELSCQFDGEGNASVHLDVSPSAASSLAPSSNGPSVAPRVLEFHLTAPLNGPPLTRNVLEKGSCVDKAGKRLPIAVRGGAVISVPMGGAADEVTRCTFDGYRQIQLGQPGANTQLIHEDVRFRILDESGAIMTFARLSGGQFSLGDGTPISGVPVRNPQFEVLFSNVPDDLIGREVPCSFVVAGYAPTTQCSIDAGGAGTVKLSPQPQPPQISLAFNGQVLTDTCGPATLTSDGEVSLPEGPGHLCQPEIRPMVPGQPAMGAWKRPLLLAFIHPGSALTAALTDDDPKHSVFWPRLFETIDGLREIQTRAAPAYVHLGSYMYRVNENVPEALFQPEGRPGNVFYRSRDERTSAVSRLLSGSPTISVDLGLMIQKTKDVITAYNISDHLKYKADLLVVRALSPTSCHEIARMATVARESGIRLVLLEFGGGTAKSQAAMTTVATDIYRCPEAPYIAVDAASAGKRDNWEQLFARLAPMLATEFFPQPE